MSDLFVCTTMTRLTVEHGPVECDMIIEFKITHYSPGCPEVRYQRNGDPGWPAEPPEYEFEPMVFRFDGGEPDDAPGPITETEIAGLSEWFNGPGFDKAFERAVDYQADQAYDEADYLYDRYRDEQMERKL